MIYADNASTAKMPKAVLESILPYLTDEYGNPSSSHSMGISASNAVKTARSFIASSINANENEIVFTSGGSESNVQAILTASETGKSNGRNKIIISAFEHDSVYIQSIVRLHHPVQSCNACFQGEFGIQATVYFLKHTVVCFNADTCKSDRPLCSVPCLPHHLH